MPSSSVRFFTEFSNSRAGGLEAALELVKKAYPQWYLDEVAEDLEELCGIFRQAGVSVIRPRWSEASSCFATPNWQAAGFDIYNVRDLHIVFGQTLVASAPSSRFRLFESCAFHDLFYRHFFDDGFRWVSAPPPRLPVQKRRIQGSTNGGGKSLNRVTESADLSRTPSSISRGRRAASRAYSRRRRIR